MKIQRFVVIVYLFFLLFFSSAVATKAENTNTLFTIDAMTISTMLPEYNWINYIVDELPKVLPIDFQLHDDSIYSLMRRTWYYPVGQEYDYIPTYAEGGYDVVAIGWKWDINWDPTGLFDTASIVPSGSNLYQYSNQTFDLVLEQYIMANDPVTKEAKATELQRILYEDLPAISVLYFRDIYGMQQDVTQIDPNLLVTLHHRPEYWDTSDHLLVYAIPVLFKEENIFKLTSYEDGLWMKTVYGGLVGYEQNSHDFAPIIAKNYTVNLSDKTILVNINSNAKFSDGNPVTAEDVKYSYELYMELTLGYGSYSEITEFLENNNSIEIVDADTLVFHLKKLDACVEELLTYGIIEKAKVEHVIEQYGYDIFKEPPLTGHVNDTLVTSCGPFVLKSYNETAIELIPNAYYVGQTPKLAKLIFRIVDNEALLKSEIKAGNIDIVDKSYEITQAEYEEEYPSMQIVVSKAFTNHELAINMKHPIFGTGELTPAGTEEAAKYVRKALSYAIDREGIINFGRSDDLRELPVPGISPMPEGCKSFDYNLQPYSYNVSLALEYLQKAGFQVTIPNTTSPTTQQATSEILVLLMAFVSVAIIEKSKKY